MIASGVVAFPDTQVIKLCQTPTQDGPLSLDGGMRPICAGFFYFVNCGQQQKRLKIS